MDMEDFALPAKRVSILHSSSPYDQHSLLHVTAVGGYDKFFQDIVSLVELAKTNPPHWDDLMFASDNKVNPSPVSSQPVAGLSFLAVAVGHGPGCDEVPS